MAMNKAPCLPWSYAGLLFFSGVSVHHTAPLEILSLLELNWSEVWCLFVCLWEWRCIHIYYPAHTQVTRSSHNCCVTIYTKMYSLISTVAATEGMVCLCLPKYATLPEKIPNQGWLDGWDWEITWRLFHHMICADLNCTDKSVGSMWLIRWPQDGQTWWSRVPK